MSEMPHVLIYQARVHELFLDIMRNAPTRLEPDYGIKVINVEIDPGADDFPVTATLERTGPGCEGRQHTVRARYVVGCDGARSNVRRAIGGSLQGDAAHQAWGVMDVLAVTDFPDYRMKALIQSGNGGTMLVLPREGGYLVRHYVELESLGVEERAADRGLTINDIIAKAQAIYAPYRFDVKDVVWWSIYEIGHRLTDKFDDVPENEVSERSPRVLLAGDACHTHSPKAGQGRKVSMGDTFNLGWKLILVLTGRADPSLLHSYSAERRAAAKGLIDFDHEWSRVIGARSEDDTDEELPRFAREFIKNLRYTSGLTIQYRSSALIGEARHQALAHGFDIGMRFHSAPVVRLADAKPMQLGHVIEADTRWRVFAFGGAADTGQEGGSVHSLCEYLQHAPGSPVRTLTRADEDIDAVIDFRAVFQQGFRDLEYARMPTLLRPHKGRFALCDYEKVFCSDLKSGEDIFDSRSIDRKNGCIVVVRPDQHVANILPLDAFGELSAFFAGFLRPA